MLLLDEVGRGESQANSNKGSRRGFITPAAHGSDESKIQMIYPTADVDDLRGKDCRTLVKWKGL